MEINRKRSRRDMLKGAALLAAGAVTGSMLTNNAARAQKASKEAMQYQDRPNGDKQCSNCKSFITSGSCAIVEGYISPNGYCMAWSKKL